MLYQGGQRPISEGHEVEGVGLQRLPVLSPPWGKEHQYSGLLYGGADECTRGTEVGGGGICIHVSVVGIVRRNLEI